MVDTCLRLRYLYLQIQGENTVNVRNGTVSLVNTMENMNINADYGNLFKSM